MEIKQIKKPGRERPYITIVDTGLAMAIQNLLAGLYMSKLEGDWGDWPDEEVVLELANRLAKELETRTF